MESKIFSKCELEELEKRKQGDKSDKFGLFSSRIRPKIEEILSLDHKELRELIKKKPIAVNKGVNTDEK